MSVRSNRGVHVARRAPFSPRVADLVEAGRWREAGACTDEDPELFFPVGVSGPAKVQEARALAVCARCPVLALCREDALTNGSSHGIQGGMTARERMPARRRNRNRTTKHAHPHNSASKKPLRVVPSKGCLEADFEAAMAGLTVLVPTEVKGPLARRMYAAGKSKTAIARALRLSGATAKRLVEPEAERAAS